MSKFSQTAQWIWAEETVSKVNQYACFRRQFDLETVADQGKLLISANWDFIAYLNGEEIGRGQFPDYPAQKTYTEIDFNNLCVGKNVLSVLVYNVGEDFFASLKAPAGLLAQISIGSEQITSDSAWRCHPHHAFYSGTMPKVTAQLGFTTSYDARMEADWTALDYDDSKWSFASVNSFYKPSLSPRPLPPIPLGKRAESSLVRTGWLKRSQNNGTFAEMVSSDQYSFVPQTELVQHGKLTQIPESFNGAMLIYDLGMERVGFIEIELLAESGTVIDLSHGEHLDDEIVRASIGDRNFTDRFICRQGKNTYHLPFRRIGGRYLQLNLSNVTGEVQILYASIRRWDLPLPPAAPFECDFPSASKLREVALRTMQLCMHDHYEDCPWREQGLYSYDSRNQMIFGYYAWGNYQFAAASLDLLGRGFSSDGHLNLCAPTHRSVIIPSFSYTWITALYENYLYSGSDALLRQFQAQLKVMLDHALALKDSSSGLMKLSDSDQYWNFYEWVGGLDGGMNGGVEAGRPAPGDIQAPQNLYIYEMLGAYVNIMNALGDSAEVARVTSIRSDLAQAIEQHFWSEPDGCYLTRHKPDFNLHEHIQYLMLALDLVPEAKKEQVMAALHSEKLIKLSFSPLLYMMHALLKQSPAEQEYAVATIDQIYGSMLDKGATTFWETEHGAADFDGAGSLCHAWSSIHVYFYGAYVLGVRPLTAGFKSFEVKPYVGKLNYAKGTVPTPAGDIQIEWHKNADNSIHLKVNHPAELTPKIAAYENHSINEVHINAE